MNRKKVLHVVRHAKSSWDYDGIADIDRSLKPKGIQNAYEISRKLKMSSHIPEMMISSPANRALHTALIFARIFEFPLGQFQIAEVLYEASSAKIIEFIKSIPDDKNSIMIFGHNPDVTEMVNLFVKKPVDMPASGVATLIFNCQMWREIRSENLEKQLFFFPKKDE